MTLEHVDPLGNHTLSPEQIDQASRLITDLNRKMFSKRSQPMMTPTQEEIRAELVSKYGPETQPVRFVDDQHGKPMAIVSLQDRETGIWHHGGYHHRSLKQLTVGQLREALADMPADALVYTEGCDCTGDAGEVSLHTPGEFGLGEVMINRVDDDPYSR